MLLHATCRPEPHDCIVIQFYLAVYFLQLLLVLFVEKFHVLCQQYQQIFIDAYVLIYQSLLCYALTSSCEEEVSLSPQIISPVSLIPIIYLYVNIIVLMDEVK